MCPWAASPPPGHPDPGRSYSWQHAEMGPVAADGNQLLADSPQTKIGVPCHGFLRGGGLKVKISKWIKYPC